MNDKFEMTPEFIKKRRDKYAEREKLLFLAMCSRRDRRLIEGEENLTIEDFDRIGYLLESLGFDNFGWNFSFEHGELLKELGDKIESEIETPGKLNLNKTFEEARQWERDFCEGLPSDEMRKYIKRIFNIDE